MAASKDYYATLGVAKNADPQVIRAAYRALAKKLHPDSSLDKSPEALQKFRELSDAHSILSDPQLRSLYDAELVQRADGPSSRQTPRPTANPHGKTPERDLVEKIRNGVVVVGWSLIGGFIVVLARIPRMTL